jgi:hypothetical protein
MGDPGLTWAHMSDDAFNGSVLSARIATPEDDQHPMPMLNDVFLDLDELDLRGAKRGAYSSRPFRCFSALIMLAPQTHMVATGSSVTAIRVLLLLCKAR